MYIYIYIYTLYPIYTSIICTHIYHIHIHIYIYHIHTSHVDTYLFGIHTYINLYSEDSFFGNRTDCARHPGAAYNILKLTSCQKAFKIITRYILDSPSW